MINHYLCTLTIPLLTMITTEQATRIVLNHTLSLPTESAPLTEVLGRVLQEPIVADRDFPPFSRITMDGIAYRYDALPPDRTLPVAGVQRAGEPQQTLNNANHCLEVMTGSILPQGADTVVRYEDVVFTEAAGQRVATLQVVPSKAGHNVHAQGLDQRQGDVLVEKGTTLTASEIAVAASVGQAQLTVSQLPSIGILSTGDELVDVDTIPEIYQIRKSNTFALHAALLNLGISATRYHLPDTEAETQEGIALALEQHDVLILSGGVSKGKHDYVPEALAAAGVEKLFHRVQQRPGKPFWFGRHATGKVVFALPGNPVSTFMCFYRYVRPWLVKSTGAYQPPALKAVLSEDVAFAPDLTYFLNVRVDTSEDGQLIATPQAGHGSGDFTNLTRCHGFLELPADRSQFNPGEVFPLHLFRPL